MLFVLLTTLVASAQEELPQQWPQAPQASQKVTEQIQVVASESTMAGSGWGTAKQVSTHIITADGKHVAVWCSNYAQMHCPVLDQGSYTAEVDKGQGIYWIHIQDGEKGKTRRIKYRVSGNW
jgi:hypothetical protein